MNVLITGGYGFIGSHVAEEFYKEGYRIFIIDNLSSGNSRNIRFKHSFYKLDIKDDKCREVFKNNKFDVVIHLAAQINVTNSLEDPYSDASSNILGLINMLKLSAQYGVKKFVFASSAAVYGNNGKIPLKEDAAINPLSPYGISKAAGELYCKKWNELYGLNTVCLRFSNVYGPRQSTTGEGGVVSIFMERAAMEKELVVFGDGNQTRDFIYVKDVAGAIFKSVKKNAAGVLNLSTQSETSINELIEELRCLKPIKGICYKGIREGDIKNSCLDNTKIKQELDWEPRYSMTEGLKSTYEWYENYYRNIRKHKANQEGSTASTPVLKRITGLIKKSGLLSWTENLVLFILTCCMTIIAQNASNYYLLDYKLIYIVLVGIIYGIRQAVLSSLLSCGLYIYLYIEEGRDIVSLFNDTNSMLQLSFYLLIGMIIGYVIDSKNNELQGKDNKLKSLDEKLTFLDKIHNETLLLKDELCEQIINTENSYGKVCSMVEKLNSLNPEEVLINGVSVLENMMKSDKVAIYVLTYSRNIAVLAAKSENKDFNVPGIVKIREQEDIYRVIKTKDIFINREWLPSLPIMTAPISDQENIVAVACIYNVEFENLTLHRQNLLRVAANLISYALTNAYKYADIVQDNYIGYPSAVETGSYILKQNQ